MKLINTKETYDRVYEQTEDPKPIFTLRKLTYGEVASNQDETSLLDDKNRIAYLAGTSSRLKIKYALIGWKNVTDEDGKEISCNDPAKDKLPPIVALWLVREIDKLNVLNGISADESKNS